MIYIFKHKLAIEIDENGRKDRNFDYEIKRQKAIEKELDCKFIRINPDEKDFDMDIHISKIHNHIVKSSKKLLTDKILKRLSELNLTRII